LPRRGIPTPAVHRRLWVNDPDCLLARPGVERREEWAATVQRFGGPRATGDDLAELDGWGLAATRRLLAGVADSAADLTSPAGGLCSPPWADLAAGLVRARSRAVRVAFLVFTGLFPQPAGHGGRAGHARLADGPGCLERRGDVEEGLRP
jgi:hypothetical protein